MLRLSARFKGLHASSLGSVLFKVVMIVDVVVLKLGNAGWDIAKQGMGLIE